MTGRTTPVRLDGFLEYSIRFLLIFCWIQVSATSMAVAQLPRQPIPTDSQWHFRYDLFQMLFEERGLVVERSLEVAWTDPQHSVLIMTGDLLKEKSSTWNRVNRYVAEGGNVFLSSDQWVALFGIAVIMDGPVTTNRSELQYQSFNDCLRIKRLSRSHPMMAGIEELISNRSGYLEMAPNSPMEWEVLATLPADCSPAESGEKPLVIIGKGRKANSGSIVVAADASLVTNNMLWQGDNGVFATNLCDWLCQGDRRQLVFANGGRLQSSVKPKVAPPPFPREPLTPPPVPEPDLDTMLALANSVVKNVAESNILNETLKNQPRGVSIFAYHRFVLWLMIACVVGYLIWQVWNRWPLSPSRVQRRPMRSALEIAMGSLKENEVFRIASTALARDFCVDWIGTVEPLDWRHCRSVIEEPRFAESMAPDLRKCLFQILDIAIEGPKQPMGSRQFQDLGRMIRDLRHMLRSNQLPSMKSEFPVTAALSN